MKTESEHNFGFPHILSLNANKDRPTLSTVER